jgi:hypothetical protein
MRLSPHTLLIYYFATAPLWISLYMPYIWGKFDFLFYQCSLDVNGVLLSSYVQFLYMPYCPAPCPSGTGIRKCRCRNPCGTVTRWHHTGTGLRRRLPECRRRRHHSWCRCPATQAKCIPFCWQVLPVFSLVRLHSKLSFDWNIAINLGNS